MAQETTVNLFCYNYLNNNDFSGKLGCCGKPEPKHEMEIGMPMQGYTATSSTSILQDVESQEFQKEAGIVNAAMDVSDEEERQERYTPEPRRRILVEEDAGFESDDSYRNIGEVPDILGVPKTRNHIFKTLHRLISVHL